MKLIKENFDRSIDRERRIAGYRVKHLIESIEKKVEEPIKEDIASDLKASEDKAKVQLQGLVDQAKKVLGDIGDGFKADIAAAGFTIDNSGKVIKTETEELKEEVEIEIKTEEEDKPEEREEEKVEENSAAAETPDGMGVANTLNALIQDEWQAIDGYNNTISTYRSMAQSDYPEADKSIDYEAIIKILEDIAQEEMNHVGMLQKAMGTISPNVEEIAGGEKEAEETLEAPEDVKIEDKVEE